MPSPSFVWLQPLWWWQIHLIQLPLNEQRETTSLWSFPFVRCIHSDYITWLSKWLCMQIIPSFLVDKASCTRQFESELSLYSLASFFPIKEGIFSNPSVSLSKGSSTSIQAFLNSLYDPFGSPCRGQKPQKEGCNRPTVLYLPHLSLPSGRVLTLYPSPKSLP